MELLIFQFINPVRMASATTSMIFFAWALLIIFSRHVSTVRTLTNILSAISVEDIPLETIERYDSSLGDKTASLILLVESSVLSAFILHKLRQYSGNHQIKSRKSFYRLPA